MFKSWCKEVMNKRECSLDSEASARSMEEYEPYIEGHVLQDQGPIEEV